MDWISWICFLGTLMHVATGEKIELNLKFDIWEGNVTVLWDPPKGAPVPALYRVQLAPLQGSNGKWDVVPECNMITETKCDLGNFVVNNEVKDMNVQVELLNSEPSWSTIRRIRFDNMKLLSPEFDLSAISNTVKVKIHRKPFLKEFYPYGLSYSAILYPRGQEKQAITLSDGEDGEVDFTSLLLMQEYCVSVRVEFTSNEVSNTSSPRCIYITDSSVVISIAVIGVVGVMSLFILSVCFFLKRPGKMPAALKSAVNGWHPMNVGVIEVETVTQKGWLLISNKTPVKSQVFDEEKELSDEDVERRESTDSGVSIGQQDSIKNREPSEEDSGCGSLTGTEDSGSVERREEDSGFGLGSQDISDNPKATDGDLLSEIVVVGDGYRSQSPSADAESETAMEDTNMACPTNGYRSGQVTCMCSDSETCVWCKTRKLLADSGPLSHEQAEDDNDRPSYLKKTGNIFGLGDLPHNSNQSEESSLFITCPLLLPETYKLDTLPLTLGDVELTVT